MSRHHMCVSVRGLLRRSAAEMKRDIKSTTKDDGTPFASVDEYRNALLDEIAKGHEVLPMSKDCDNFDFKKGCQGHEDVKGGAA